MVEKERGGEGKKKETQSGVLARGGSSEVSSKQSSMMYTRWVSDSRVLARSISSDHAHAHAHAHAISRRYFSTILLPSPSPVTIITGSEITLEPRRGAAERTCPRTVSVSCRCDWITATDSQNNDNRHFSVFWFFGSNSPSSRNSPGQKEVEEDVKVNLGKRVGTLPVLRWEE